MYQSIKDGEWFEVKRRGDQLVCCDCGLVHDVEVQVRKRLVRMRAFRNAKATTARRRIKKR